MGASYPQFTCPNCRAVTDLEAELDADDGEDWEQAVDEPHGPTAHRVSTLTQPTNPLQNQEDTVHVGGAATAYEEASDVDLTNIQFESNGDDAAIISQVTTSGLLTRRQTSNTASPAQVAQVNGIEIPRPSNAAQMAPVVVNDPSGTLRTATPTSADIIGGEGPLTPRNNAGPFVFDGSAGRASARRITAHAMDESD